MFSRVARIELKIDQLWKAMAFLECQAGLAAAFCKARAVPAVALLSHPSAR